MKASRKKAFRFKKYSDKRNRALSIRKFISYEDQPLAQYQDEDMEKINASQLPLRILLILLLCTIATAIWANWSNLSPDKLSLWLQDSFFGIGHGNGYPYKISGKNVSKGNFKLINKGLAFVTDTSFVILNKSGKEVCNRQHGFSMPMLKVDGDLSLIYNQNGKEIQIESISKQLLKNNYNKNIQAANICSSGIYAVATDSDDYLGELTVYGQKNDEKFKYYFSKNYVNNVSLNNKGDLVCTTGLNISDNMDLKSNLYLFNTKQAEPILNLEYTGIIIDTAFTIKGDLVVIGENFLSFIDTSTKKQKNYDYQGNILTSYEINKDLGVILTLSSYNNGRDCKVLLMDTNGEFKLDMSTDLDIESCSLQSYNIALLNEGNVFIYGINGKLLKELNVKDDARKVISTYNKEVYVLGVNEIRKVTV